MVRTYLMLKLQLMCYLLIRAVGTVSLQKGLTPRLLIRILCNRQSALSSRALYHVQLEEVVHALAVHLKLVLFMHLPQTHCLVKALQEYFRVVVDDCCV